MNRTVTAPDVLRRKGKDKLTMLTAYDYPSGLIADEAGMDMVLVGDSLGMVVLGYEDTVSVTMDDMVHHCKAAARGVNRALLICDMPFLSYQASIEQAVGNAGRLMQEGRARAVKLEGGSTILPQVKAIVDAGIPVMGHLGLTPQHVHRFGGFKAQAKTVEAAEILLAEALVLQEAGVFSLVLEAVPLEAARLVTEKLDIPTIGIGAGNVTDGQVLVFHDLLGLFDRFKPKFVKRYADLRSQSLDAIRAYADEVRDGTFPAQEHTFFMNDDERDRLDGLYGGGTSE